jgi:hypothetical protein
MVHLNLVLWFAMVGAIIAPAMPSDVAKWTAVIGLAVAACWEHSVVRGFSKKKVATAKDV